MSPRCRVLVVDDEAPARRLARSLLAEMDDVEVIGDVASGQAAVDAIRQLRPDIVLLDVQMPGLDGFGVVAAVGVMSMPAVDRKSTRLNSSHPSISYAVFCLKKKKY